MALDRLAELKAVAGVPDRQFTPRDEENPPQPGPIVDEQGMSRFWLDVRECQRLLKKVRSNTERLDEIRQGYNSSTNTEAEKNLTSDYEDINNENTKLFKELRDKVESLQLSYKKAQVENTDEPETRMKEAQVISLGAQTNDLLRECQAASVNFKQAVKDRLKRQIHYYDDGKNKMTDEQIDNLIERNPQEVTKMMEAKLLGRPHLKVENAVRDIEDKCRGIEQLHENVIKLHEMIREISEIVHQQGQQIDLVYNNVTKAKDYVDKGNKNLVKAKEYHMKARKKQCCIILIAVAILCILLFPVLITILK